jgi:hypothetical protein
VFQNLPVNFGKTERFIGISGKSLSIVRLGVDFSGQTRKNVSHSEIEGRSC